MKKIFIFIFFWVTIINAKPLPLEIDNNSIQFRYLDNQAKSVFLAGSFNNWNDKNLKLHKVNDFTWKISKKLKPGIYLYKFIVDGKWLPEQNLTFMLIPDENGNLILKLPTKSKTTTLDFNKKIKLNGDYFVSSIIRDQTKWRIDRPIHDFDLNFDVKVSPEISGFFQLNWKTTKTYSFDNSTKKMNFSYNNKVYLDEGYLQLKNNYIDFYASRDRRILDFYEPAKLIDKYNHTYRDDIYFYDEPRNDFYKFGRDWTIIKYNKDFNNSNNLVLFTANKYNYYEDLFGINYNLNIKNFNFSILGLYHSLDDEIYGDTGSGNNSIIDTNDTNGGWLEYPRNSNYWYAYDYLYQTGANDNYSSDIATSISIDFDKISLFGEIIFSKNRSKIIAYSDGYDTGHGLNNSNSLRQISSYNDINKYVYGLKFKTDNLKLLFSIENEDISAKEIINSINSDVSKDWINFNFKLRYKFNKQNFIAVKTKYLSPNNKNNISYFYDFDKQNYNSVQLDGIDNVLLNHISLNYTITDNINLKYDNYFNNYNMYNSKSCGDITTNEIKTLLSFKKIARFTPFLGGRFKSIKIDNYKLSNYSVNENFFTYHFGVKINYSKNVYFKISYGLGPYQINDDKTQDLPSELDKTYNAIIQSDKPNQLDFYLDNVLETEKYLEDTDFIVISGSIVF